MFIFVSDQYNYITNHLARFKGDPMAVRLNESLTNLRSTWSSILYKQQKILVRILNVIYDNINSFLNSKFNYLEAINSVISIMQEFNKYFNAKDNALILVKDKKYFEFVPLFMSLFDKGSNKSKHIFSGLAHILIITADVYTSKDQSTIAHKDLESLGKAFDSAKRYLDQKALNGSTSIDINRVQVFENSTFFKTWIMSELKGQCKTQNTANYCLKLCRRYAKLVILQDFLMIYSLLLTRNQLEANNCRRSLNNIRRRLNETLSKLYFSDSKIMPYFDPDDSPLLDAYAIKILNVRNYSKPFSGLYCIQLTKDLVWSESPSEFKANSKPFLTLVDHDNRNCYWKIVPHQNNTFTIVSKKECDKDPSHPYCNAMLSFERIGQHAVYGTIDHTNPLLFEIDNGDSFL